MRPPDLGDDAAPAGRVQPRWAALGSRSIPQLWYFSGPAVPVHWRHRWEAAMDHSAVARRAEQAIMRLCHAGLDSRTLRAEVLRRLRTIVPVDAAFCATVDPATLLFTGSLTEELPESATAAFLANEFLQDDVTKFVALAHATRPVQSLYAATRGEPVWSPRYREILAPIGFGDELRAALRIGAVTWGVLCLHRDLTGSGFTAAE